MVRFNGFAFLPIGRFLVAEIEKTVNSETGKSRPGKIKISELRQIMEQGVQKVRAQLGLGVVEDDG